MITVDLIQEERMKIEKIVESLGCEMPTVVTDIYKNRGGRYYAVKIFRYFDKGTCRMKDLFMTTQDYEVISIGRFYEENTQRLTHEQTREAWANESI